MGSDAPKFGTPDWEREMASIWAANHAARANPSRMGNVQDAYAEATSVFGGEEPFLQSLSMLFNPARPVGDLKALLTRPRVPGEDGSNMIELVKLAIDRELRRQSAQGAQ